MGPPGAPRAIQWRESRACSAGGRPTDRAALHRTVRGAAGGCVPTAGQREESRHGLRGGLRRGVLRRGVWRRGARGAHLFRALLLRAFRFCALLVRTVGGRRLPMVGGVEPRSLEDQPDRCKDPPGRAAADGTWPRGSANLMVDLKQVIAACATVFVQRHQPGPLSALISIYRNALPRCQYSRRRLWKR